MLWWMAAALAVGTSGSKQCTMQGRVLDIAWTEAGVVRVVYEGRPVVSANIGHRKGPTSATCLPTGVKFLTDTQEVRGKLTLETVKMDLSSVLETLRPPAPAPAPKPKPRRPRPKPAPAPPPPEPPDPGELQASECVQSQAWDAYSDGWSVRSISTEAVGGGARRNLALQLIKGQEVRVLACAQEELAELKSQLVNEDGFERAMATGGRRLLFEQKVKKDGVYYVLVTNLTPAEGHISVAVLTR